MDLCFHFSPPALVLAHVGVLVVLRDVSVITDGIAESTWRLGLVANDLVYAGKISICSGRVTPGTALRTSFTAANLIFSPDNGGGDGDNHDGSTMLTSQALGTPRRHVGQPVLCGDAASEGVSSSSHAFAE